MAKRGSVVQLVTILTMAVLVANCTNATKPMPPTTSFHPTPLMLPIPADVQRVAVLYPREAHPDWSSAYGRLEGAAFQLKTFRPKLRIIDRSHMSGHRLGAATSGRGACFRRQCRQNRTDVGRRQRVDLSNRRTNDTRPVLRAPASRSSVGDHHKQNHPSREWRSRVSQRGDSACG